MTVSYDVFLSDFLQKITEYTFLRLGEPTRTNIIEGYLTHSIQQFNVICKDIITNVDEQERTVEVQLEDNIAIDEIVDIISEGMLVQWFKPYMYKQENLENLLNTVDFSSYSPAELLGKVTAAYKMCKKDFTDRVRSYTYDHGDLTDLHL